MNDKNAQTETFQNFPRVGLWTNILRGGNVVSITAYYIRNFAETLKFMMILYIVSKILS